MSQLWYFAVDGAMQGPLPEEDLRRRFLQGELSQETLVWAEGMAAWAPAARVHSLTSAPPPPPPPGAVLAAASAPVVMTSAGASRGRSSAVPAVHRPWARLGARVADILLFQLVVSLLVPAAWIPEATDTFALQVFMLVLTAGSLLAWTFLEAFLLSRWGMTPGKWMYRVRIVNPHGHFLTYSEALRRSLGVFVQGLALGLPGVQLIAMALAYKELNETGLAPWDRGRFLVQHAQPKPIHQASVFLLLLVFLLFSVQVFDRFSGG